MFLDRTAADNIHYMPYNNHGQTHALDDIAFYSRWLVCESRLMYPHMPERVMRQFGYLPGIPIDPSMSAPPAMVCKDVD